MQKRNDLPIRLILILAALLASSAAVGCSTGSAHPAAYAAETRPASGPSDAPLNSGKTEAVPPASDPSSVDLQHDTRPLIACFGDSLTAGYGIPRSESYPAVLQRLLDKDGYRYRVVNDGVSGDTTKDGVDRIDKVLNSKPRIVVLEFGGNDGLRGLPVTGAEHNLAVMIQRLQHGGARVALAGISLPPQYGGQYISQFNAMYPALASRFHVALLPFLLQNVWGVQGDVQEDGVHPTAQGAKKVASNVEALIQPMLNK